jgi:tRNA:m4X modification enzyme
MEDSSSSCRFYVSKKRRYCHFEPLKGQEFCAQHIVSEDRVPCPVDPRHNVLKSKLNFHVRKCNKTRMINELVTSDFYAKGINTIRPSTDLKPYELREYEETMAFIRRVNELYDKTKEIYKTITSEPLPEILLPSKDLKSSRHHIQSELLVSYLETYNLIDTDYLYIEFGAGKGALSHYISLKFNDQSKHLLVEREARRYKYDRNHTNFRRIRCDIADLDLSSWQDKLVGVGKHVCGAATDLSITAIGRGKSKGLALATCCHHLCELANFISKDLLNELGFEDIDILSLFKCSSWAVSGAIRNNNTDLCTELRTETGMKAKMILDIIRAKELSHSYDTVRLLKYCTSDLSPESNLLIAVNTRV